MSYIFDYDQKISFEQAAEKLEYDIQRFTKACQSEWPRPIDYTNLIDAQHALKTLNQTVYAHV
ncbi:hypothetical protein N9W89_12620 [Hellea sp.]|nr:hypothetical protein [Hellea sp.]